ncbi:hypothetical protein WA171_007286 [Blastocystis sp. BT1]
MVSTKMGCLEEPQSLTVPLSLLTGDRKCDYVNGKHGELSRFLRTFYIDGEDHWIPVFSQRQMERLVRNYKAPAFNWHLLDDNSPNALYWYQNCNTTLPIR